MTGQIIYNNRDMKPLADLAKLNEGALTPETGSTTLGKFTIGNFADELAVDDLVVSDGLTSEGVIQVKKRTNEVNPLGKLITNPVGYVPTDKAYAWGEYEPREATIEFKADSIITVTVKAGDTAVTHGSYLALATDGTDNYLVSANPTHVLCLGDVEAGKTVDVPVLDGYRV